MECPWCGYAISEFDVECPHCGYSMSESAVECPWCGYAMSESAMECPHCGYNGEAPAPLLEPASAQLQSPQMQLADYVARARAEGLTNATIRRRLLDAGWAPIVLDDFFETMALTRSAVDPAVQSIPQLAGVYDMQAWTLGLAPLMYYPITQIAPYLNIATKSADLIALVSWIIISAWLLSNDVKQLDGAGYDTSSITNGWFIPHYLFARARLIHGNNGYAIVWIVCFALVIGNFLEIGLAQS